MELQSKDPTSYFKNGFQVSFFLGSVRAFSRPILWVSQLLLTIWERIPLISSLL